MSVVLSVEDVGACRKQVRVEVPAPAVEAELERVALEYRKRARVAGFRKGKVPLELVRKKYAEEIRQEVLDRLVPRYWHQAEAEVDVEPMLPPEVEGVDFEPGAPLTFTATVDVKPEIEIDSLDGFDLPEVPVEVSDDEVDRALEELRRSAADWVDADRPAGRGDLVRGTIVELGEDDAPQGDPGPFGLEVGDADVWEELTLAVTGLSLGGESTFTRGEGEEARKLRVRVESIRERDLPPLDDSLAPKIGDFETLDEVRQAVRSQLERDKQRERLRRREGTLLDQLCERHPIELPEAVVRHETESMLRDYAGQIAQRGVDPQRAGIDWQKMGEEMLPQARRRVQARLLLDAAAERLGVKVDESEFERHLGDLARLEGRSAPEVRRALHKSGRLEDLRRRLVRTKTVGRLLGENEGPGETSTSEEPTNQAQDGERKD